MSYFVLIFLLTNQSPCLLTPLDPSTSQLQVASDSFKIRVFSSETAEIKACEPLSEFPGVYKIILDSGKAGTVSNISEDLLILADTRSSKSAILFNEAISFVSETLDAAGAKLSSSTQLPYAIIKNSGGQIVVSIPEIKLIKVIDYE